MRNTLIDAGRGFAALWVVAFHYSQMNDVFRQRMLAAFVPVQFGYLGVPIFFVISGYCIAASASKTTAMNSSMTLFLRHRLLRVFPAFWGSIIVFAIAPYLVGLISYFKFGHFPDTTPLALFHADLPTWLRVITLTQGFADGDSLPAKWGVASGVYWTLGLEIQFYAIVALALSMRPRQQWIIGAVTLISIFFLLNSRTWETGWCLAFWPQFVMGWLVFHAIKREQGGPQIIGQTAAAISVLFLTLGAFALLAILQETQAMEGLWERTAFAAGFALWLWCLLPLLPQRPQSRGGQWMARLIQAAAGIGLISYSIYLLHMALLRVTAQMARQVSRDGTALYDLIVFALLCGLCVPFYWLLEQPFVTRKTTLVNRSAAV